MAMDKSSLSPREAAIVEAARREASGLGPRISGPEARTPSAGQPDSGTRFPAPAGTAAPDTAMHVTALIEAERERSSRRWNKLRQVGTAIPALILIAAVLWVIVEISR